MNRPVPSPTRFAEAEKINPYQILVDLHDHATGRPFPPTRNDALAELAMAAAAASWWGPVATSDDPRRPAGRD